MKLFGTFVLAASGLLTAAVATINIASAGTAASVNTEKTIIDVMVLYTKAATQTYKGRDIDARISAYISYANKAYDNSNVNLKLRLVHSEKLKNDYYPTVNGYNLDSFRADGYVQNLRKKHGADIVSLVNLAERTNDGYITCGIGYVPQGYVSQYNSEGKFHYGASSQAYNLVGVDCGYNTFVHELGHNMGLGHSVEQKSKGGVYQWARGYGEYGNFTTVMAYPYVFGATGLLQFSNPSLYKCNGRACGIEKSRYDGSDSSANLNKLAKHIAGFMPTMHPLETDPGEPNPGGGNGTGGTGNQPEAGLCKKPYLSNNLLSQGDFNQISNWSKFRRGGYLEQESTVTSCGKDNVLHVKNRPYYYSGPMQEVTEKIKKGHEYEVSAKIKLVGDRKRDDAQITLEINDGQDYQYLADASVTNKKFTTLKKKFKLETRARVNKLSIFAYGPNAGVDFIIDEFKLVEVTKPETPNEPVNPMVLEESFENWNYSAISLDSGYYRTSYHASKGRYSLMSYNRRAWHAGAGVDVTGNVKPGKAYQVTADVKLENREGTAQPVSLYLLYTDKNNPRRNYWHRIARKVVTHSQWFTLSGALKAKGSQYVDAKLVVIGPDRGMDFYLDNIKVTQ